MRSQDIDFPSVKEPIHEGPSDDLIEENYSSWREVWDLDRCTMHDIYEAGFRHGYEAGMNAKEPK